MKGFYLTMMVVGTVAPWLGFGAFFAERGLDIVAFAQGLFANGAAAGFAVDVLLSILIFLVWSRRDARTQGVNMWWLVLPASFAVGLSLALPLYLYLRESNGSAEGPALASRRAGRRRGHRQISLRPISPWFAVTPPINLRPR